jgi:hypothetical protein
MSIVFNGTTQLASRATVPDASSFVIAGWFRRTSDSGAREHWFSVDDGSFFNQYSLAVSAASDQLEGYHGFNDTGAAGVVAAGAWSWVMYRFSGGTLQVRRVLDGGTAWASNQTVPTLATLAPTHLTIGARFGGGTPSEFAPATCALVKVWSGGTLPTDAEVLAERLNTAATITTGLWARYVFASGSLGTDGSGNSRTLTLTGTPTFSADNPTDLTVSGGSTPTVSSISPTSGPIGTVVTVNGTNLGGTSSVSINATGGTTIASNTATGFTFVVGAGTTTGALALTATAGSLTGGPVFTVTAAPVFTPPMVVVTNANTDYLPGVLLSPIVVEKRDQFGAATTLGPTTATITEILDTVDGSGNPVTLTGTLTESFVGAQATFDDLTPAIAAATVARGFRVLMHHYS